MAAAETYFPPDHPAAQGHFPGNPVIPGAVLLNEVLQAVEAQLNVDLSACNVRFAKFFAPVRPGDRIAIEFSRNESGAIRFACTRGDSTVLNGEVACGAGPKAA